jgi:hypothetical protein
MTLATFFSDGTLGTPAAFLTAALVGSRSAQASSGRASAAAGGSRASSTCAT